MNARAKPERKGVSFVATTATTGRGTGIRLH